VVVGASGYIGGRLVDKLIGAGELPRVAGRRPETLARRWPSAEAVMLDVLRPETIEPAVRGADLAYYLVHSMAEGEAGFAERDRMAAHSFANAAKRAGVRRIVYLGGLGSGADRLSPHLSSRQETGRVLDGLDALFLGDGSRRFEGLDPDSGIRLGLNRCRH